MKNCFTKISKAMKSKILFLDFDRTMTEYDSCLLIPSKFSPLQSQWKRICDKFVSSYDEAFKENLNTTDLFSCLDRVEEIGVNWIEKSMILKGISKEEIGALSKTIKFREDCIESIKNWIEIEAFQSVHIVSSNWSSDIITLSLSEHNLPIFEVREVGVYEPSKLNIFSNEYEWDESGKVSSGKIIKRVTKSSDKLSYVESVSKNSEVIFVGDSMIDILAILESDFGFLLSPDKYCLEFLEKVESSSIRICDNWKVIEEVISSLI